MGNIWRTDGSRIEFRYTSSPGNAVRLHSYLIAAANCPYYLCRKPLNDPSVRVRRREWPDRVAKTESIKRKLHRTLVVAKFKSNPTRRSWIIDVLTKRADFNASRIVRERSDVLLKYLRSPRYPFYPRVYTRDSAVYPREIPQRRDLLFRYIRYFPRAAEESGPAVVNHGYNRGSRRGKKRGRISRVFSAPPRIRRSSRKSARIP